MVHQAVQNILNVRKFFFLTFALALFSCSSQFPNETAQNGDISFVETDVIDVSISATIKMESITGFDIHPSTDKLIVAGTGLDNISGIFVFDSQSNMNEWLNPHINPYTIIFHPDGSSFFSISLAGYVDIIESEVGRVKESLPISCGGEWLYYDQENKSLLLGAMGHHVTQPIYFRLLDTVKQTCITLFEKIGVLNFVDISQDFKYVAASINDFDNYVYVWDLQSNIETCKLHGDFGLFVPELDQIAVLDGSTMKLYEPETCVLLRKIELNEQPHLGYLAFNNTGSMFASIGSYIELWDTKSGKFLHRSELSEQLLPSSISSKVKFNSSGSKIIANFFVGTNNGARNSHLLVWDIIN